MGRVIKAITKHFSYDEEGIRCPCCDRLKIVPGFFSHMKKLEKMRQELGFALIINSGYRCPAHNEAVNGSPRSWHMLFATDVRPTWGKGHTHRLKAMYKVALVQKWGGIGYYGNFLHLDMRPEEARWRE